MSASTRRTASARTRQRPPRRKLRASKSGNAAPGGGGVQTRRRQRWRNRYLRGAVWVFLVVFLISVVGVIVAVRRVGP